VGIRQAHRATLIVAFATVVSALLITPWAPRSPGLLAQESSEVTAPAPGRSFSALVQKLETSNWAPPYFKDRVTSFEPVEEDRRIKEMLGEPYSMVEVGMYSYRDSPSRAAEGRRLFFLYDFGTADNWRSNERYMFYALGARTAEEASAKFGYLIEPRGHFVGLVAMPNSDGKFDFGWSCALCHAGIDPQGRVVPGAPNHLYDGGRIRHRGLVENDPHPAYAVAGYVDRDVPLQHLASMGPGRLDRNGDRIENPVKIPSLWGLRAIRSGLFANGSGANIWFALGRHNGGVHPASEYMEALVSYLLELEPPPNPRLRGPDESRGEDVFKKAGCVSCHSGPYYTNGEVIPIEEIGTDDARVRQEFPKGYRVPTLRRLDLDRLYLHDGSVTSLQDLFAVPRPPDVKGHAYGLDLTNEEKHNLVAFLLSL